MPAIWEIVSLTLMAGFKYMVAVFMAIGYGWSIWYSISFSVLGGMMGVLIYIFFGGLIKRLVRQFIPQLSRGSNLERRRVLIERVKGVAGLAGIALLTPVLLTVPIGTLSAVGLGYPWPRILVYMFVAFSFWSFLFFGLYDIVGIDIRALVESWI
mgnify:CR=1 FL=1